MFRNRPPKDKDLNHLKEDICYNKKHIQEAWQNYYGFIHYYPESESEEERRNEILDIDTFCASLGYVLVRYDRDRVGKTYWRYSSLGNWEYF